MKKRWFQWLIATLFLTLAFAVGCTDSSKDKTEAIESTITLDRTEMSLKVGDASYIVPSFEAKDGVSLVYRVTDETVISVSEYGEVTALKEGTADVVVTYGDLEASCKVTVSLGGELPRLVVAGVEEGSTQQIAFGETIDLAPYVAFNGRRYDDATFTYGIADQTVVCEQNGELLAKACGETAVTLKASWRGVENATLELGFSLRVIANVEMSVNGGKNSVFDLYSVEQIGDRTYVTEMPFEITAKEKTANGVNALTASVEVLSGAELISIDEDTVASKGKAGTATVLIACKASTGESFTQTVTVNVLRSLGKYQKTVEFSAVDGELPLTEIFGCEEELTSAEYEGNPLTISEDKKRVLGLPTLSTGVTKTTLTVYGQDVGYEIEIDGYTKIVNEASDFEYFCLNNDDSKNITTVFDGYYVLGNDIDASGYVRGTSGFVSTDTVAGYATLGLTGTFDGRGYTVYGLTFGETASDFEKFDENKRKEYTYSLFGVVGGGTVKNLALVDLTYAAPSAVTKGSQSAIATWIMGGTLENVYVHIRGLNYSIAKWRASSGLAHAIDENSVVKNCIVEVENDGTVDEAKEKWKGALGAGWGSLVGSRVPSDEVLAKNWKNVYVVSAQELNAFYSGTTERKEGTVDALNINPSANRTVTAIKRYADIYEFLADGENTYADFDTDYWQVNEGGVPVWKGLDVTRYACVTVNGEPTTSISIDAKTASGSYQLGVELLGEALTEYTVSVVGGAGIEVNGSAFSVLHAGTATVSVAFEIDGEQIERTLRVAVTVPTETYGQTVEFSAMHGELPLADIFGESDVTLVAAYQGEDLLTISADGKRVLGVQPLDEKGKIVNDRAVTAMISVYSVDKGYEITLNAYMGILKTAEDLNVFNLDNTDYAALTAAKTNSEKTPKKVIDGYFVLGGNIDASNYAMPTQGYVSSTFDTTNMPKIGFQGTFDGCGYTISGITFGTDEGSKYTADTRTIWNNNTYSLFGVIGKSAVVKNVAITDVKFMLKNSVPSGVGGLNAATCSTLATWIAEGASVENVFVSVKGIVAGGNAANTTLNALAYGIYSGAALNNIVVDYTYSGDDVLAAKLSSFTGRKCANTDTLLTEITTWTNVYILSEKGLTTNTSGATYKDGVLTSTGNTLTAANEEYESGAKVTSLYKYASLAAWKEAQDAEETKNDFTSFAGVECWNLTGGIPVFNSKK